MKAEFANGYYSIDDGTTILKVDERHRILNIEDINARFNVKIPTYNNYTIERLLQHEQIQHYSELYNYLSSALESITKQKEVVIYEPPIIISEPSRDSFDLEKPIAMLKLISKVVMALIIVWIVVIVMELTKISKPKTTLRLQDSREHHV